MEKDIITVNFRLAAKAFIVQKGKLFVIKRSEEDVQMPGIWEIPGGRLELGEDPLIGLMREIREETGMYIETIYPLSIRHFRRVDGQWITMIILLCKPKRGGELKLSDEHSECKWIDLKKEKSCLNKFFWNEVEVFEKLNLERLIDE